MAMNSPRSTTRSMSATRVTPSGRVRVMPCAVSSAVTPPRAVPLNAVPPYIYPEPLFGYLDEPFYGFEPPLFSFPPWWTPRPALPVPSPRRRRE